MSQEEFENYVALMGKLLQLTSEQREQISGELQDHLQMRVAELVSEGVAESDAISQAVEEFGDAAAMAKNFQTVQNFKRRRWMMRFATYSIAGAFLAAILTMAMWPDNARFGSPGHSLAQSSSDSSATDTEDPVSYVSAATKATMHAEETLKQIVSLQFDERPFSEIQLSLAEKTGLNILLSSSATDDSLDADTLVTFNLIDMPLNKALKLMLVTHNATYVIDEGVIVIISLDDAEDVKWFRLKMYDCRDLVKALPKTAPTGYGGGGGFDAGGGRQGGGGGVFSVPATGQTAAQAGDNSAADEKKKAEPRLTDSELLDEKLNKIMAMMKAEAERKRPEPSSEQTLLDLVQNMIEPDTWQDTGQGLGTVEVVNGILIVSQTEGILQQIDNFIADLEGNILRKRRERVVEPRKKPKRRSASDDSAGGKSEGSTDDPFK